ncbi:MAG TPA: FlgO family outer membrane protein [Candidatus Eisenbacteria bacterium]|jgi:serine/threonine protein kinase/tetratricopeptide (TPR) repeat protein|nr:FlgO family outer membrane protein [Candidatus Eisenbacteria bacterium]
MRDRIGSFRILDRLGEGGMGVVYAAQDERLQRRVAIKMIRDDSGLREARDRFWREARSAAKLNHPNVCQIYDVGEEGSDLWIAMELLEGEPLASRMARDRISLNEAGPIVLGILAALDALHRHQIVHRDLKPSNVFLTSHGVKLLDFGLARPIEDSAQVTTTNLTRTGIVVGTPRYMSPEQWKREPIDARSDIFAVGVILYEMISGTPAFPGQSPGEIRHAALFDQPAALSGPPAVMAVDRVIQRAISKDSADRYPAAQAMADELRSALRLLEAGDAPRVRAVTRLIVLPFRALRPDPDCDFLTFSLPDAITGSLAGIDSLVVRSSLTAAKFTSATPDLKQIAEETEVDLVLTGTLMRAGDKVRVNTQLLDAATGTVAWTLSTQASMGDLFELQDGLARHIVESLSLPLSARERGSLQKDVPVSAKAYEFYLRANQLAWTSDGWTLARDLYLKCLEADPKYAPAWAQLGRIYRVMAKYLEDNPKENLLRAADAFHRALEINPDLSLAHNLYVYLEVEMGRATEAMTRLLDRARDRPSEAGLFAGLVQACRYCGLLDASLAAAERALRLDPNIPTSITYTHWMSGDYERAMQLRSNDLPFIRGYSLMSLGRNEEALEVFAQMKDMIHLPGFGRSMYHLLVGNRENSLADIRSVLRSAFLDPEGIYFIARGLAYWGELEESLRTLDRVVEGGFYCDQTMARDPWLDPMRTTPEFVRILRRAESLRRGAIAAYLEHQGDRILGVRPAS